MAVTAATVVESADRAVVAEVAWREAAGRTAMAALTPLTCGGAVCFALPFAATERARALASAGAAVLVLSDSRMALRGWRAVAASGAVTVRADLDGAWAAGGMLEQELRKHPPSRMLIDSPLQRREHWWYLARWIVTMGGLDDAVLLPRRRPEDGVMILERGSAMRPRMVQVRDWESASVRVRPLDDRPLPAEATAAVLFKHDFSIPDGERRTELLLHGTVRSDRFQVQDRQGALALPERGSLRHRLRAYRAMRRSCCDAISTWRHA